MRDTDTRVRDGLPGGFGWLLALAKKRDSTLGGVVEINALKSMSADNLWTLYEQISSILTERITAEKAKLDERLRKIETASNATSPDRVRRPYPKVLPKYQNPKNPAEMWSGRGKQPHWVQAQLKAGKKLEHFLIARPSTERRRRAG
jgi:DNA-binding protein H-NS